MLDYIFFRHPSAKPDYLERIDELPNMQIVRLKGAIDHTVIPEIEKRIEVNRHNGPPKIEKNLLLDFKDVTHVDSSTIAFHLVSLKEYQASHHTLALLNVPEAFKAMIDMFHFRDSFKIYDSEEHAIAELG